MADNDFDGAFDQHELEARCFGRLDELEIPYVLHRHPAVYTVAEAKALRGKLPGAHVKNLFLCDRRKRDFWLLTAQEDRPIDLKALSAQAGAKRIRFANQDLLAEILGIGPGAVTPLAVLNDEAKRARLLIDEALLVPEVELLNVHPLHNAATVAIAPADLVRFAEACGHPPILLDLG